MGKGNLLDLFEPILRLKMCCAFNTDYVSLQDVAMPNSPFQQA